MLKRVGPFQRVFSIFGSREKLRHDAQRSISLRLFSNYVQGAGLYRAVENYQNWIISPVGAFQAHRESVQKRLRPFLSLRAYSNRVHCTAMQRDRLLST